MCHVAELYLQRLHRSTMKTKIQRTLLWWFLITISVYGTNCAAVWEKTQHNTNTTEAGARAGSSSIPSATPKQDERRGDIGNDPKHRLPNDNGTSEVQWNKDSFVYRIYNFPNGSVAPLVHTCRLVPTNPRGHLIMKEMIYRHGTKLIDVHMHMRNTSEDKLDKGTWGYKSHRWSRVVTSNGQTILNLAFNFNVLSLMTLSFGVKDWKMDVIDEPRGCIDAVTEPEKIKIMLDLAVRDFNPGGDIAVIEGKSAVCHKIIGINTGKAIFENRCCSKRIDKDEIECYIERPNKWLQLLDVLLAAIVVLIFVFGSLCVPEWMYAATHDFGEYVVKLKEPLYKKMCVCRSTASASTIKADHVLDLRNQSKQDFVLFRKMLADVPPDMIVPIKISQFDIRVVYRKLLTEENVPVGLIECIARAVFFCKIRDLDAFKDCCEASYLGSCQAKANKEHKWINVCNVIGRLALVLALPAPFYIRLILYYYFEHTEIGERTRVASRQGLDVHHNYRLMQHLTPTHPIYIASYVVYLAAGMTYAYCTTVSTQTRFQKLIINAFAELNDMSFLKVLAVIIRNLLLPFRKYGLYGCACSLILWPVYLPLSLILIVLYCLPVVFLTCQVILWICKGGNATHKKGEFRDTVESFEYERLLRKMNSTAKSAVENCYCGLNMRRFLVNMAISMTSLLAIYSVMLLASEVFGYILEMLCFTLMGLIVNAGSVLKYGSLIFLVIIYSYDTYNVVNKKYLKLNKSLFNEIKFRISDIEEHTKLPSHLQENRGFKAVEASEQADYEVTDDINVKHPFSWNINDLILFIDSDDTPRIPRKLFDETCEINVAGTPGPVYRSLMMATAKFLAIILFLVFVFVVVMSFGDTYRISSTNQMLATLAGGFMPYIFRSLLRPGKAKVETDLLCFKSKLNEIIQNFCQTWPMYDFIFEVEEKPEENDSDGFESDSSYDTSKIKHNSNKKAKKEAHKLRVGDIKDSRKSSFVSGLLRPAGSRDILNKEPSIIREKELAIKEQIEQMELTPIELAESEQIDILVLVSDRDTGWEMEISSTGDVSDDIEIAGVSKRWNQQGGDVPKIIMCQRQESVPPHLLAGDNVYKSSDNRPRLPSQ